jgi:hypothetical protein
MASSIEAFEKHRRLWCAQCVAFFGICISVFFSVTGDFWRALPFLLGSLVTWWLATELIVLSNRVDKMSSEAVGRQPPEPQSGP